MCLLVISMFIPIQPPSLPFSKHFVPSFIWNFFSHIIVFHESVEILIENRWKERKRCRASLHNFKVNRDKKPQKMTFKKTEWKKNERKFFNNDNWGNTHARVIISFLVKISIFFLIFENLRTLNQFCELKKLSWKSEIFTKSFWGNLATIVTSLFADFQNSKIKPTLMVIRKAEMMTSSQN